MRRYLMMASLLGVVPAALSPEIAAAQDRCEQIRHDNRVAGTVIGAVGGALLGGAVAGNRGHKDSGALLGAVAGGFIGNQVGGSKDPCPDGYQRVDDVTYGLHEREAGIEQRIRQGVDAGQLDRRDADRALDRLNDIRAEEGDMRNHNGGALDDHDRTVLWNELDELEHHVAWSQPAPPPPPPPPPMADDDWRDAPPGLHDREAWLEERIHDGAADGRLDSDDAHRLDDQLRSIRDEEYWLTRDHGGLTPDDEHNLQEQLDNLFERFRHEVRHDR
jgi:hypothetical protein